MTLKINGATGGSVSIDAPDNTSPAGTNVTLTLPTSAGSSGQYLQTNGTGTLSWQTVEGLPDAIDVNASAPADSVNIDSSGRLLVGTSSNITSQLIQSHGTGSGAIGVGRFAANAFGPEISFYKSRNGTVGSNTIVQNGDYLGANVFHGNNGSGYNAGATIAARVDGTPGVDDMPTRLEFSTTADGSSSPTERMRIKSDGTFKMSSDGTYRNVSTASHELVQTNSGFALQLSHETSSPAGIIIQYTGAAPNNNDNEFLFVQDNTISRGEWRSNGGIANYQANDSNLCDEREKKNIVDLESTWDCLKQWELKKFHYNEDADTDDKRYGVIAQQIAEHCPEVITDWKKQKAADAVLDEDGNEIEPAKEEILRMGVKEQQMYWMAIRALQEAQIRIETLETANASQAATIAALDARLTALEGGAA